VQPKLIALLSTGSTISRHSLILTGSPVAVGRKAPTDSSDESPFMRDGDIVKCWVEGIGELIAPDSDKGEAVIDEISGEL